ncbi:hypothetical protein [Nonomuraea wenchangensis]|uniref:Uncharacterized protein n=1 Tax=Nonomuraea wenchangensis TaxID=568860 RepID=A0A1I0L8G6_9ACTN|nr:hypothetical protein [Nonomuraea wenchangensis]SEU36274.1 hypothetical protein SAMN05421811_113174 [Nonomuraea wenchangensis]
MEPYEALSALDKVTDEQKVTGARATSREDRVLMRTPSPSPAARRPEASVTYEGLFDEHGEPSEDSLDYMSWDLFQNALSLYRLADQRTMTPLLSIIEGFPSVSLTVTSGKLAGYGQTKSFLLVGDTRLDLTKDVKLRNVPDVLSTDAQARWQIEVSINQELEEVYKVAHTLNHELSLHAAAFFKVFRKVTLMLAGPADPEEKNRRLNAVGDYLVKELLGKGPSSDIARHRRFATDLPPGWRIMETYRAMQAVLAERGDKNGAELLRVDFNEDRAARAAELELQEPGRID